MIGAYVFRSYRKRELDDGRSGRGGRSRGGLHGGLRFIEAALLVFESGAAEAEVVAADFRGGVDERLRLRVRAPRSPLIECQ